MRIAKVLCKGQEAGLLTQLDSGTFIFRYADAWFADASKSSICLSLSKSQQMYQQEYLFPFFYNMLAEGANKNAVCKSLRIDANDSFGLLMATAKYDTIGAITIEKLNVDYE